MAPWLVSLDRSDPMICNWWMIIISHLSSVKSIRSMKMRDSCPVYRLVENMEISSRDALLPDLSHVVSGLSLPDRMNRAGQVSRRL